MMILSMELCTIICLIPPILVYSLYGSPTDIFIFGYFILRNNWDRVRHVLKWVNPAFVINISKISGTIFIAIQMLRYLGGLRQESSTAENFPVKPMLFPCRTSHVRMFPKKHGFNYSYLMTGIPVGWEGSTGGMISVGGKKEYSPWSGRFWKPWTSWYTVNADDYLGRGHVEGGLLEKLSMYLKTQNVDHKQYAFAYLLTAAKFLGYASNPVSIWHLYSAEKKLKALVLEVNNTFDERHIYFLEPEQSPSKTTETPPRFTGTWHKDFYVSTFNTRSGAYSLAAYDPLFPSMSKPGPINCTITLSTGGHAMLIARINSEGSALDPSAMSTWQKTRFLASWWWVGLATFPRTIREALTLLMKKKMPWVFRPEPRKATMPRHADELEKLTEYYFRAYLRSLIETSEEDVKLRYISAGIVGEESKEEVMMSPSAQLSATEGLEMEVRVLTPLFYSRLVQYSDILDALDSECFQSFTVAVTNPEILSILKLSSISCSPEEFGAINTLWNQISSYLISLLRRRPPPITALEKSDNMSPFKAYKAQSGASGLDIFVYNSPTDIKKKLYLGWVLRLMVAERIAFGWIEILDLEVFVLRIVAAWLIARRIVL